MNNMVPLMLTLCLEENTILVSTAILDCLGNPRQIQMMINDDRRSLIIHPCDQGDRESILIPERPMYQFEYPGPALLRRIRRLTKWPDTNPRAIYGTYIPLINAVVFDLMEAQIAILQPIPDDINQASSSLEPGISACAPGGSPLEPGISALPPGIYGTNTDVYGLDDNGGTHINTADSSSDRR